jgi:GntR family transcriptional regulator, arabinose operon transcriptional repressor
MSDNAEMIGRVLDGAEMGRAQPKYQLLKRRLVADLTSGLLKPGQALPSEDSLAARFRVARSTVRQALAEMEQSGLVRRVQGSGTYVEDQVQTQLKQGLDLFALIVPVLQAGYYLSLQQGFDSACKDSHCQMIVSCSEDDLALQSDILMQLLDKQVGGVALLPAPCSPTPAYQVRQIRQRGIPLVFCHRGVDGFQAPLIEIPFHQVGRLIGETLVQHGHRRVAYFPAQPSGATTAYESGLREALVAVGGDLPREFVYRSSNKRQLLAQKEDEVIAALTAMLQQPDRPTAIMTSFDPDAETLFLLLIQMGLRIPDYRRHGGRSRPWSSCGAVAL